MRGFDFVYFGSELWIFLIIILITIINCLKFVLSIDVQVIFLHLLSI